MVASSVSPRVWASLIVASAFCPVAFAAAPSQNAKLTVAENKVSVAGHATTAGAAVTAGQTIVTGAHSRAEVTLPDGAVVRIGQSSSFSFDGSKLVLNQGSALFHLTRKNTTISTPALVRTGQPGVVSVHASPKYNALFVLEGSDTVNGTALVAGQAWVRDGSTARTFAFDLNKLTSTSTLVTKFPVTPWIASTQALAAIQQKLVAANNANPTQIQVVNRTGGATTLTTANGITLANSPALAAVSRSGATTGILGAVRSFFSGGNANGAVTQNALTISSAQGGLTKAGAGTLTLVRSGAGSGITLNSGSNVTDGTLQIAGNNTYAGGATISLGSISANGNTNAFTVATGANTVIAGTAGSSGTSLQIAPMILRNSGSLVLTSTTLQGGSNGSQPFTGALTVNAGNLTLPAGFAPPTITLVTSGSVINGVTAGTLTVGQQVTLGGAGTYAVGAGTGGALLLTRVGGVVAPVLGVRPPSPVPLPPKAPGH